MKLLEPAQLSDRDAVNKIDVQVNDLHVSWRPDIFQYCNEGIPEDFFEECVEKQNLYVARMDGEVVGFVIFFTWQTNGPASVPSKVLDLDAIAIDEFHRHQGIGTMIMEDMREIARELGCNDIQLSVYPQNENAIRFYEKCGFRVRNIRYQMYI